MTVAAKTPSRAYHILIADLVGLRFDADGQPDPGEVREHIARRGGHWHDGERDKDREAPPGLHFYYLPDLSREDELIAAAGDGQYDALIAAATFIPAATRFAEGGVRIGAGTGNMGSASWGGGDGAGGSAPLMNTPGFNARATAQMAMKALLKINPDLPVAELHSRVCAGNFDTGKHLRDYPTRKLEGQRLAVIGYGNIGREFARLGAAFGMRVVIHARPRHRQWIESEGFDYAPTALDAARGANVLSAHVGLGPIGADGRPANAGLVGADLFEALEPGAVLINYDRGELVDCDALDQALASGQVRHAAIDADLFVAADDQRLSGPITPYLALLDQHADKLELLPHAAADTEHVSRVEGACQAVDQIIEAIVERRVTNLKGDLPAGYQAAGQHGIPGVGGVRAKSLSALPDALVAQLQNDSEQLANFWRELSDAQGEVARLSVVTERGEAATLATNRLISALTRHGLAGPFTPA